MSTAGDRAGAGPERAYGAPLPPPGGELLLDRDESAHLVRVRRVAAGEEVVVFDGCGGLVRATLCEADPRGARVRVLAPYPARAPVRPVEVRASLPEPARADDLVATLAELGVVRLVAIRCARTPEGRGDLLRRREARFARAAREALKVNGVARPLEIVPTERAFADALEGVGWLLDTAPDCPPLGPPAVEAGPGLRVLWVGPEGGFTDGERALARAAGIPFASLGGAVLRASTAAAVAAAVLLAAGPGRVVKDTPM